MDVHRDLCNKKIEEIFPYIQKQAVKYKIQGYTQDDILSDCYTIVFDWLLTHDWQRYKEFELRHRLHCRIKTYMDKLQRQQDEKEKNCAYLYDNNSIFCYNYTITVPIKWLLKQCSNQLSEKEKRVICLRYFKNKTLTDCANDLGVSRERVRQIETKSINKMRQYCRNHKIERTLFE